MITLQSELEYIYLKKKGFILKLFLSLILIYLWFVVCWVISVRLRSTIMERISTSSFLNNLQTPKGSHRQTGKESKIPASWRRLVDIPQHLRDSGLNSLTSSYSLLNPSLRNSTLKTCWECKLKRRQRNV